MRKVKRKITSIIGVIMNKKLILIVSSLVSAPVFAMKNPPLQPWVVAANTVKIKTIKMSRISNY